MFEFLPAFPVAMLLIALAMGYIVVYLAKREEKDLQSIGYIIGAVIMIIATFGLVAHILLQVNLCTSKGLLYKGMKHHRMMPRTP